MYAGSLPPNAKHRIHERVLTFLGSITLGFLLFQPRIKDTTMNTFQVRNRIIAAVAGIFIASFGFTACSGTGSSAIAGLDDGATATASAYALNSMGASANSSTALLGNADMTGILNDMQTELLDDIFAGRPNGRGANGSPNGGPNGTPPPNRDSNAIRPEAMLEVSRRLNAQGTMTSGGAASARFNSALGVQGVSVAVMGAIYQLVTPPMRPEGRNNQPPGGGRPNSTNANARPPRLAETIFVYPLPPSSTATTTMTMPPSLITLSDAPATANFTVRGYTLGETTIDIPGKATFTSVKEGDALSRSSAVTVRWNPIGTFTGGVLTLRNVPDSAALAGKTRREAEAIIRALPKPVVKPIVAGTSSVEFSSAELGTLQTGAAHLALSVANVKRTNSDKAVLKADSHSALRVRLQ
ncbi:MAG: hypothetical protein EAZ92_05970 [Candidatus Kapaibacterium sp.]|nr:MAG: hypothetical protein EAZ92_05970 [Candidatus Kapabacteria bacterium]